MFMGETVEHTTSWLTINPFKGCSLGCGYCFRMNWHPDETPIQQLDVSKAVEELIADPRFVPHKTPVSINISSTDALLPSVKESTFKAIQIFEAKKLRNPFGITTKLFFKQKEIKFLETLQYVRPIIFISLAFIPTQIEPTPTLPRIKNLRNFSKTKVPCVHYLRPIVEGWNDSDEVLAQALQLGNSFADAICIGSLRVSQAIKMNLMSMDVRIEENTPDFHNKSFKIGMENRILEIYKKLNLTVPLFKHTSCAVSFLCGIPNYNLLFKNPTKNCISTCPESQQLLCKSQST